MHSVARDWADKISAGQLDRVSAYIALTTTIWKTLSYPLSATLLTKPECKYIMSPVLKAALPKMGINRNFPRVLVHVPHMFQGLGLPHIYTTQSVQHTIDVLTHQLNPDITTQLHRASFETLYLLLGVGTKFLATPIPGIDKRVPNTIAQAIQQFSITYCIKIQHNINIPLQRDNYSFLMTYFLPTTFSNLECHTINKCQFYLHVLTISNMTTGDGTAILSHIWEGTDQGNNLRGLK